MSLNSSSSSLLYLSRGSCIDSRMSIFILTAVLVTYILVLVPLFIFVLYLGYQRWRKQRCTSQAVINSHSDIFTYNMATLELFGIFGTCLYCYAAYSNESCIYRVGLYMFEIISPAQTMFHLLTCAERYLAIVHPITYLGLKQMGGVRIRNIIVSCVWLLCIASVGLTLELNIQFYLIANILFLTFSFTMASFCSFSMLPVLIRPGPGEVGGNRERVDQSKLRAFHTIMAITGALFLRFLTTLVFNVLLLSSAISYKDYCTAMSAASWFSLPSSLVLPVLFLHRVGKLPGSKQTSGSV